MSHKKDTRKRQSIPRETRKFQLRKGEQYPLDEHVSEILNYARTQRREVTLIREAISLYWALEQGNIEELYERFPQYKSLKGGGDGAGGLDEIKALLESIQADIKTKGVQSMQPIAPMTTGKQIAAPSLPMPSFEDDDEPFIATKKNADMDSGTMFIKSLGILQ